MATSYKPTAKDLYAATERARVIMAKGRRDGGWILHPLACDQGMNTSDSPQWLVYRHYLAKQIVRRRTGLAPSY